MPVKVGRHVAGKGWQLVHKTSGRVERYVNDKKQVAGMVAHRINENWRRKHRK